MRNAAELPLRDIQLPDPVSWWPPAPGWWLLLLASVLVIGGIVLYRQYHARRRVLYALQDQLQSLRSNQQDARETLQQLSVLLRRACISFFPREQVASLTGDEWIRFLNAHTGNRFDSTHGMLLTEGVYRTPTSIDDSTLQQLIELINDQLPVLFDRRVER